MKWWQWTLLAITAVVIGALSALPEGKGGAQTCDRSTQGCVRTALEDVRGPVEDPDISAVDFAAGGVAVTAKTPGGGLEGTSPQDLDYQVGAIFQAIYGDADYDGGAEIEFEGGLLDGRTGQDLPHAVTGRFAITARKAKRIDWSDQDTVDYGVDWSLYRTFLHPAIER